MNLIKVWLTTTIILLCVWVSALIMSYFPCIWIWQASLLTLWILAGASVISLWSKLYEK